MSIPLLIAALLAVFIAGAHSYLGERFILMRLFRRDNLPRLFGGTWFTERTLRFAWHVTSLAWIGFAAILVLLAGKGAPEADAVRGIVASTFFLTGLVAAVGSKLKHLSWIVFFAIAILTWAA